MKKNIIFLIVLLLMISGLTGCLSLQQEQPVAPVLENTDESASAAVDLVVTIPETHGEEILNIPGRIGPGLRVFINEAEALIDPAGNFNVQVQLVAGKNPISIQVLAEDNTSVYSTARNVDYVTSGNPLLQLTIDEVYRSDSETMILRGVTEADCNIDANGYRFAPDEDGNFIVGIPLEEGDNIVKVVSTNPQGKTSTVQQVVSYSRLNSTQPTLVVSSPEPSVDGYISSERIKISGFTEPNNVVEIYNNYYNGDTAVESLLFKGTTTNGQFTVDVTLSKDGGGVNDLLIVATNSFGRTASEARRIIYKETP